MIDTSEIDKIEEAIEEYHLKIRGAEAEQIGLFRSELQRVGIQIQGEDYDSHDGLWYFYINKDEVKTPIHKYYSGFVVITL